MRVCSRRGMWKMEEVTTKMDEEVTDTAELSCPICLVTSNDNTNEALQEDIVTEM